VPGKRLTLFSPRLAGHGSLPTDYIFMFHVVYGDDENTLIIEDCGCSRITRPAGP
jgi:hypothetical protein